MRKTNAEGLALIKSFEKLALFAYMPTPNDRPTIGYGNTFYEDGTPVKMGDRITEQRANELFNFVVSKFEREVDSLVKSNVNQNQFSALVSFAYNLGSDIDADKIPEGLGDSTLLKKVNSNPNDPSIRNEFAKWNKQKGKVLNGLTRRRNSEANLYFKK